MPADYTDNLAVNVVFTLHEGVATACRRVEASQYEGNSCYGHERKGENGKTDSGEIVLCTIKGGCVDDRLNRLQDWLKSRINKNVADFAIYDESTNVFDPEATKLEIGRVFDSEQLMKSSKLFYYYPYINVATEDSTDTEKVTEATTKETAAAVDTTAADVDDQNSGEYPAGGCDILM